MVYECEFHMYVVRHTNNLLLWSVSTLIINVWKSVNVSTWEQNIWKKLFQISNPPLLVNLSFVFTIFIVSWLCVFVCTISYSIVCSMFYLKCWIYLWNVDLNNIILRILQNLVFFKMWVCVCVKYVVCVHTIK